MLNSPPFLPGAVRMMWAYIKQKNRLRRWGSRGKVLKIAISILGATSLTSITIKVGYSVPNNALEYPLRIINKILKSVK